MNWYTLRVISGKESKIKDNILFELDYKELSTEVNNILIPSENIVEMREGKKKVKIYQKLDLYYLQYVLNQQNYKVKIYLNDFITQYLMLEITCHLGFH